MGARQAQRQGAGAGAVDDPAFAGNDRLKTCQSLGARPRLPAGSQKISRSIEM